MLRNDTRGVADFKRGDRSTTCRSAWLLFTVFLVGCSDDQALTGDQIQTLFSGKTVTGHHEVHDYDFESYYDADGTFRSYQDATGRPKRAKWWVASNDMCIQWETQSQPLCRPIVSRGNTYRKVVKPNGKLIVTFESFQPGNPKSL